jgi:hypothetical protein
MAFELYPRLTVWLGQAKGKNHGVETKCSALSEVDGGWTDKDLNPT